MKSLKNGNLAKLVAFFLIAVFLIIAIAFSASGWQENNNIEPDSGNADGEHSGTSSGNADENTDGSGTGDDNTPVLTPTINYMNYITGLEVSAEEALLKPLCLVFTPDAPMYGISSSFLNIEVPIEGEKTRFLAFTNDATSLGKIGSIAPIRKYISNFAVYFGGTVVSYGSDDSFSYSGVDYTGGTIDFTKQSGYHYSEYGKYYYTNADLVDAYIKNNEIVTIRKEDISVPYIFNTAANSPILGDMIANTVLIPFSSTNSTEFTYSHTDEKYYMSKNTASVTDMHNSKQLSYDNVFILLTDSVTHETASTTQLIMNTSGSGKGYYLSKGKMSEITWNVDKNGQLIFLDGDGSRLLINPGASYIGVAKSSRTNDIQFG